MGVGDLTEAANGVKDRPEGDTLDTVRPRLEDNEVKAEEGSTAGVGMALRPVLLKPEEANVETAAVLNGDGATVFVATLFTTPAPPCGALPKDEKVLDCCLFPFPVATDVATKPPLLARLLDANPFGATEEAGIAKRELTLVGGSGGGRIGDRAPVFPRTTTVGERPRGVRAIGRV